MSQTIQYSDLQQYMDRCIGKFGLERTVKLLGHFLGDSKEDKTIQNRLGLVVEFLKAETANAFNLNVDELLTSKDSAYYEARMLCYAILHHCEGVGPTHIGRLFSTTNGKRNRRQVSYWLQIFDERQELHEIEIRHGNKLPAHALMIDTYEVLVGRLMDFINNNFK